METSTSSPSNISGAGVGAGNISNDGPRDVFFAANTTGNRLYNMIRFKRGRAIQEIP